MSELVLAILAWWEPAPDGSAWSKIDAAWCVLWHRLDAAESLDQEVPS